MAFDVGTLQATLTADDRQLDRALRNVRRNGEQTARNISRSFEASFSDPIPSINELQERIQHLRRLRADANDTVAIESYNREIQDLTQKKRNLETQGTRVEQSTNRLNNAFRVGIGLIASYFSVQAARRVFSLAQETARFADEIDKLNIRTGLGVQRIQELQFVTDQLGVNFQAVERGVEAFTRRIGQIDQGSGRVTQAMRTLGISIRNAEGEMRSMDDLFDDIVRGLQGVDNETQRNALAMEIFGRQAAELVPLLAAGADEVDRLTGRFNRLGTVMDEAAIQRGVEFNDRMNEMRTRLDGVKREVGFLVIEYGEKLLPVMEDMIGIAIGLNRELRNQESTLTRLAGFTRRWIGVVSGIGLITPLINRFTEGWANARRGMEFLQRRSEAAKRQLEETGKAGGDAAEEIIRAVERVRVAATDRAVVFDLIEHERIKEIRREFQQLEGVLSTIGTLEVDFDLRLPDVGSIDNLRARIAELRAEMTATADPERVRELREQIEALNQQIRDLEGTTGDTRREFSAFGAEAAQIFDRAVFQGERLQNVLQSVLRQLASRALVSLLTGGTGGIAGGLFAGVFHGGGIVGGSGDQLAVVRAGEGIFTPSQMRALGDIRVRRDRIDIDLNVSGNLVGRGDALVAIIDERIRQAARLQ